MPRIKKSILYVDGYNIINSWQEFKDLLKISLEVAREELIKMMQEYQKLTGVDLYLIFDSYREKRPTNSYEKRANILVVYTKEFETADSYIERACHLFGKDELVRVATSDMALQNISLGSGATRISAREFRNEYLNIKRNAKENYARKNIEVKENIVNLTEDQLDSINRLKKIIEKNEKESD